MVTITVLMGPPGAGKTTWVEANLRPGVVLCSTERLRLDRTLATTPGALIAYVNGLRAKARAALMQGSDVLVDACNTRTTDRSAWLRIARETRAQAHLRVFHAPPALLEGVDRGRPHPVGQAKLARYQAEHLKALTLIGREGWARIDHEHRGGITHGEHGPKPRTVSKW